MIDRIALLLLIIGGINWGLVGIFQFDLVAFLFGGAAAILSRIIYVLVAISAIWCISLLSPSSSPLQVMTAGEGACFRGQHFITGLPAAHSKIGSLSCCHDLIFLF